jgi:hypothetical protein
MLMPRPDSNTNRKVVCEPRKNLMAVVHEAASDLHSVGAIDKKTMHEFDGMCLKPVKPLSQPQGRTRAALGRFQCQFESQCFCHCQ